jgi:ABC-2 type transport system ATP-binding protein
MISLQNLTKFYGPKLALDSINVDFAENIIHGIIGLNGAGKTTLFNLTSSYLKADSGRILKNEVNIKRSDLAYLESDNYFYSKITGKEYLDIFKASNTKFKLENINSLLQVPLNELIETYSTGMKKKLAIMGVLKQERPIYIFDEPFNGLDLESNKVLEIIIFSLKSKGKTIFISSHILAPLLALCDQIHLLKKGLLVKSYLKDRFIEIEGDLFNDFERNIATEIENNI